MLKLDKKQATLNRLPLVTALLACLYGPLALAQAQPQAEPPAATEETAEAAKKPNVAVLERVKVTGSLLKRLEYESASPVQVITADISATIGQFDTAEMLQKSSVASGSTQINHQFAGFVIEGGTGVQTLSLRGIGAQRTLVLLDGRRPGPAGTRGQVGAFDLNVIPSTILQRIEILKDGSSSIYGSDAVAGVVNMITRRSVDKPTLTFTTSLPFESGGEQFTVSGATGWDFDKGSIVLAGEWYKHEALTLGDRDFLGCSQDLIRDAEGNIIDREDRSILAGTELAGCNRLYANTVIDAVFGTRYVPSPNGVTIGLIPGYRPRVNKTYANSPQAYYEDVLNFDFLDRQQIINEQERKSLYFSSDFDLGGVNWHTQALYNNRTTKSRSFRQFFPLIGGATAIFPGFGYDDNPTYAAPVASGIAQPVMPFTSDQNIDVDYFYIATGFEGEFGTKHFWNWSVDASYSHNDGEYSGLGIVASRTGDLNYSSNAPTLDYFSPAFLSGERMDDLVAALGEWHTGHTTYNQVVLTGVLSGDLFELPAGAVSAAVGAEYRRFSINDVPSDLSQNGDLWGQSSAQVTEGDDKVIEAFAEIEVPLIAGKPGFELLSFNASARAFDYDSVDGSDYVWKIGMNWQILPSLKLRATKGTSYRAPGLYELYLGNQTGFLSQLSIDPCIAWADSSNDNIRANCAAQGIPDDYAGGAASATIVSGGGAGVLEPETSQAFTAGIVFTPTFANFSVSFDYFKFEVNDQISQLGAGSIIGGCYSAQVFPNAFCNLFDRNPSNHATAPFAITQVRDSYLNVNKQVVRGYDMLFNHESEFSFGKLQIEGQVTYQLEAYELLFSTDEPSGFETDDRLGFVGFPQLTGSMRTSLKRGDWTYTWFMRYVDATEAIGVSDTTTYFGFPNAVRDIRAEARTYHGASVLYDQDKWSLLVGVENLFDAEPPTLSTGTVSRYGNIPAFATQYDLYGRTGYVRFNYKF
ncbi:MAG: TonB-dependent receptor [Arenimonas sp.]|jgi:outer membrane receptor protein involved in Fe transport